MWVTACLTLCVFCFQVCHTRSEVRGGQHTSHPHTFQKCPGEIWTNQASGNYWAGLPLADGRSRVNAKGTWGRLQQSCELAVNCAVTEYFRSARLRWEG